MTAYGIQVKLSIWDKIKYMIIKRHSVMDVSFIMDKSGKKRRKFYVY